MIVNDLISSVSRAIFGEFGEEYKIYAESVEQGLEEPCFFVQCINSSLTEQLGGQFFMENLFCIQYFPKEKLHPVSECIRVSERLYSCLEYVSFEGNPIRSIKKNYEIHDGILNFFLNYNMFVRMENSKKVPEMKKLEKIILEADYEKHR